ncbi:MAG: apolipoprotein N-acyltransferase [Desulfofustis sp.]|nr:apolipoprotein N-acyltransferase [Desulfofustis sp.]
MRSDPFLIRGSLLISSVLLTWLALPGNFSFWPLLVICLVPLFGLLHDLSSIAKALFSGFVAGIFFYLLQLYWIVPVLQTYGGLGWYLAVPALLLLVCYMSFYPAIFAVGFHLMDSRGPRLMLPFAAASLWVGLDWVRSWMISGFPWMDIGYGLWTQPRLLQIADLVGHHGLTFFIVMINATLFMVVQRSYRNLERAVGVILLACICMPSVWYSVDRWEKVEKLVDAAPVALVGVAQGNVEQTRKWSPEERLRTVKDYVRLSTAATAGQDPSLIVWPETALPFYPRADELLEPVSEFVDFSGTVLLTGAPWFEAEHSRTHHLMRYYNGALLMEPGAGFSFGYFKSHLVPFGEYVPLKKYLPFLAPLVEAAGDFTPGTIDAPLLAGPIKAGILICFESIFPDLGRAWVEAGANLLVNLTNDAWYGKSSAPYQSWAMTVFRSVETRRSLVRSANTGISGFIDPLGQVQRQSGLFVEWAESMEVSLLSTETFFVRTGYRFAPICGAAAVVIIIFSLLRRNGGSDRW